MRVVGEIHLCACLRAVLKNLGFLESWLLVGLSWLLHQTLVVERFVALVVLVLRDCLIQGQHVLHVLLQLRMRMRVVSYSSDAAALASLVGCQPFCDVLADSALRDSVAAGLKHGAKLACL